MNETLLILHVLSAAAWIGAGFYNAFLGPRIGGAGGDASLAWANALGDAAVKYFMPVGILTLLTGVSLVLVNDAYGWGDLFVNIGLAVVIAGALIGALGLGPSAKAAVAAIEASDFPAAGAAGRKGAAWGRVIVVLLTVAVVVMVLKTGT